MLNLRVGLIEAMLTCPPLIASGSNLQQGLILDGRVYKLTDRLATFDDIRQSRYEGCNIVHGVIIITTTGESHGCGVISNGDVLDGRRTGDCELHDEKCEIRVEQFVISLETFKVLSVSGGWLLSPSHYRTNVERANFNSTTIRGLM